MKKENNKEDLVYVYNKRQSFYYMQNGVMPEDCNINKKTQRIYFTFSKEKTKTVYDKWCKQCEEYKNKR